MEDDLPSGVRGEFETLLARVPGSEDTYDVISRARYPLIDALADSLLACELDALWWAFDEMCDVWPEQRAEAFELSRRAATEWLALATDDAIEGYLDRWDLLIHQTLLVWGPSPIVPDHAIPNRLRPPTPRLEQGD
jgi:hypothetical protein